MKRNLFLSLLIVLFLSVLVSYTDKKSDSVNTFDFKGLNWARPVSNYAYGQHILSGLDSLDGPSKTALKTDTILSEFKRLLPELNTIRIPVNPATATGNWWPSYTAAIDKALEKNMKVIIAYWCSPKQLHKVEDPIKFFKMWDVVVEKYKNKKDVYFEVFNEPVGYNGQVDSLISLYSNFIERYEHQTGRKRIILDGAGWAKDILTIGKSIPGCLLSLHMYPDWKEAPYSVVDYETYLDSLTGPYTHRTIVTEYGCVQSIKDKMTIPNDYSGPIPDVITKENNDVPYLVGMTNQLRKRKIGSIYWCGIRFSDKDYNKLITRKNEHSLGLKPVNPSGLSKVREAWKE